MSEKMQIELGQENAPDSRQLHVSACGRISRDALARINDVVTPVAGPDWRSMQLMLDLTDATFLDSAGISSLLSLRDEMDRQSGGMVLCSVPQQLNQMFEIIGMSSLIPVADSVRRAKEMIAQ